MSDKNDILLSKIIMYCDQIEEAKNLFGVSKDTYTSNSVYRNACNMCILQIGELVVNLDDEVKEKYSSIPWRQIRSMRNIFAHNYHNLDYDDAWETIHDDVPELKNEIEKIISNRQQEKETTEDIVQESSPENKNHENRQL